MLQSLVGVDIGLPKTETGLYYPYPASPIPEEQASEQAVDLSHAPNALMSMGRLANPSHRNLINLPGMDTVAMDLAGIIFHSADRIELTPSSPSSVKGSEFIKGDGALVLASVDRFILWQISTHRYWRAEQLRLEGALVSEIQPGHYIASIPPQRFDVASADTSSGMVIGERLQSTW